MSESWVRSLKFPGIYFRTHRDGRFELIGSVQQAGNLAEVAEEIRREFYVKNRLMPNASQVSHNQFDLFPFENHSTRSLRKLPVLRRTEKSA